MSDSRPWFIDDASTANEKHAPATLRNRDAIVSVLQNVLPDRGTVLEIASGTGEHAVYFGQKFPGLQFQPSDPDPECCRSISAWAAKAATINLLPPLQLDTLAADWAVDDFGDNMVDKPAAILCINMVHISPWEASIGLMKKAAALLQPGAPLFLYGPYLRDDVPTSESNLAFERSLKSRDLRWGLRDVTDMDMLAGGHGFDRVDLIDMPTNNISLIYRRT